jgi:uncharacterized membrane protein HdeD (DUF308 family)
MGRRLPICKPNPLTTDDGYEGVSHGTKTSAQIAGERVGTERGGCLQDPVICPAVVFVKKLNVLSGHGVGYAILFIRRILARTGYTCNGNRLIEFDRAVLSDLLFAIRRSPWQSLLSRSYDTLPHCQSSGAFLLIVFGVFAVGEPFIAAVAVTVAVGWLIILAGVVHLMLAFHAHRGARLVWKLLVGLAYIAFGVYLILHPLLAVASLTLVLAALFLIEGMLDVILFFNMRPMRGSFWVLVDGIITVLLGLMIYLHWPSSSVWAIGVLVGVSMIISGVTRVMLSLAVRKVAAAAA